MYNNTVSLYSQTRSEKNALPKITNIIMVQDLLSSEYNAHNSVKYSVATIETGNTNTPDTITTVTMVLQ